MKNATPHWTAASIGLFAVLAASNLAAQPAGTADIEKTLRSVEAAWATLDPAKAAPFYAKDAGNVFFDLTPLKYAGWSEYEAGTRKIFADFAALSIAPNTDLAVHSAGNWAWATATVSGEVTMKPDATHAQGAKMPFVARWTVILEKRANAWTIVHEHLSAPMEMPGAPAAPAKP